MLITKYIKKSSSNGLVTTDYSIFVAAYGHFVIMV